VADTLYSRESGQGVRRRELSGGQRPIRTAGRSRVEHFLVWSSDLDGKSEKWWTLELGVDGGVVRPRVFNLVERYVALNLT
jgi:hypothetical protein